MLTRRELIGSGALLIPSGVASGAAAAPPRSPIAQENAKPGTTEWRLTKVEPVLAEREEDLYNRRKAIEGYCTRTSVRAGEKLSICVSTNPADEFRLDVYRMGYYGGAGGRLVKTVGPQRGTTQPDPTSGPRNLVEARWSPSVELPIPKDWVSGVYLGKLTAQKSGYQAYVVFVVRDDRRADFLFQCSDITWQAYNRWPGGRSLYDWNGNPWHTAIEGPDVGFDRPYGIYMNTLPARFLPHTNGAAEFLMWEQPLAFWLEREGYDVTYISNLDTDRDPAGLLRARGFLSVGHDEYWTERMIANVTKARDAGVSLAFLSGNSVQTTVSLDGSSSGQAGRVFRRKARLKDEQDLMGVASYGVGLGHFVCQQPDHWVYAGTGMKKGDFVHNLVGWEFHGAPFREDKSLVVLASAPLTHENHKMGEHAAVIYDGPKGNFVFNAGTCWWNLLLAKPPGFVNPPNRNFTKDDPRVQRMTKNVLDRMRSARA